MELPSRHPKYQTPPECGSAPSSAAEAAPVYPDPREELRTPPPLPCPGKGCCKRAGAKEHRQRAALTRHCCQRHSQLWKLRLGQGRGVSVAAPCERILSAACSSRVAKHALQPAQGPRKGYKNIQVAKLARSLSAREHVPMGLVPVWCQAWGDARPGQPQLDI